MALDFSGTNQNATNNNGISNIDINEFTVGVWVYVDAEPSGTECFAMFGAAIAGGNLRISFYAEAPGVAGFKFQFAYSFSGGWGLWIYDNLSVGQWHHILVHYDRSATANDPDIYINGSVVSETEDATPSGSALTGVDSLSLGENVGGGDDFDGKVAELGFWSGDQSSLAPQLAKRYSPKFFPENLLAYWDLIRDGREHMQGTVAALTLSGATAYAHPPIINPAPPFISFPSAVAGPTAKAVAGSLAMAGALARKAKFKRATAGVL